MSYLDERRKFIEDGRPLPAKKKHIIPKKSAKRIQKEKQQGIEIVKPKQKAGWFDLQKALNEEQQPTSKVSVFVPTEDELKDSGNEQWEWFLRQRDKMTGICSHCGGKSMKDDNEKFHYSIAHLLSKNFFKSVATNDFNWIELCYYGKSCHANFDHAMIPITQLNCFDEVIEKFVKMYPSIAPNERRRIPPILMEYIKNEL